MPRFYKRLSETFYILEDLQKTVNEVQLFFYLYSSLSNTKGCVFLLLIKCFFKIYLVSQFTPIPFRSDKPLICNSISNGFSIRGDLIQVFFKGVTSFCFMKVTTKTVNSKEHYSKK